MLLKTGVACEGTIPERLSTDMLVQQRGRGNLRRLEDLLHQQVHSLLAKIKLACMVILHQTAGRFSTCNS